MGVRNENKIVQEDILPSSYGFSSDALPSRAAETIRAVRRLILNGHLPGIRRAGTMSSPERITTMKWVFGVFIMAFALGWAAVSTMPAATASIDDVSLKFLPPETQGVAFMDVASLRSAPLLQDESNDAKFLPKSLVEFIDVTGFDVRNDVDKVTIAKLGPERLVIVQGRIDKFKIVQFMQDKGRQPEAYLGQTLYTGREGALVIFENTVILGQLAAVKKAVEQMQLPGSLPLRGDLMVAMQSIEAGNQIWGVGDFSINDLGAIGVRGPAPVFEMLKSLESGTYQMRVDTGIHARATGKFANVESATKIAEMGRGAIALVKLQVARRQPEVLPVLDGIQIDNSGPVLTVHVEQSGELLQKLKDFVRPTIEKNLR